MVSPPHHGYLLARPAVLPSGGARFVVPAVSHDPDPSAVPTGDRDPEAVFPDGVVAETGEDGVRLRTRVAPARAGRERLWLQATREAFTAPAVQVVFPRWVPQQACGFGVVIDLGEILDAGPHRCRFVYDGAVSPVETVRPPGERAPPEARFGETD